MEMHPEATVTRLEEALSRARQELSEAYNTIGRLSADLSRVEQTARDLAAGQRSASEARAQAFLEQAEELAAMTPQERETHLRHTIDRHEARS